MTRLLRIVAPGLPHLITACGHHGQAIAFDEADYALYRSLLGQQAKRAKVKVWAWAMLPTHVHLIVAPPSAEALARAIGETHRRYAAAINSKARRSGHLFGAPYSSVVLDEEHLRLAIRYVSLSPERARLVDRAEDWPWSSARVHAGGAPDGVTLQAPGLERFPNFPALLRQPADDPSFAVLRAAAKRGRPLGSEAFKEALEKKLGRTVRPQRRGRKKRK
jgi:putative transposase